MRRSRRVVQGVVSSGRRPWWLRFGVIGWGGRLARRRSSCVETCRVGNFFKRLGCAGVYGEAVCCVVVLDALPIMSRVYIRVLLQCCNICVIAFLVFWVTYVISDLH